MSPMTEPDLSDPNRLLTVAEAAELCGMSPATFRGIKKPAPDDPDLDRAPSRRQPRWRLATIAQWQSTRRRRSPKKQEEE